MRIRFTNLARHLGQLNQSRCFTAGPAKRPPQTDSHLFEPLARRPIRELFAENLVTDRTLYAIDDVLHRRIPEQTLSEPGYRFWSGFLANLAAAYDERHPGQISIAVDTQVCADIGLELGFVHPDDLWQGEFAAELLKDVFATRPGNDRAIVISSREIPDAVHDLNDRAIFQLCDIWHVSLTRFVVDQDRYENGGLSGLEQEDINHRLLRLYAWYTAIATDVGLDLDRPLANAILRRIDPRKWELEAVPYVSYYSRKLRQMRAIERAIGTGAVNVTGYIDRGLPTILVQEFIQTKAKQLRGRLADKDVLFETLLKIFGRYYYLMRFGPRFSERRLDRILAGAAQRRIVRREELAAVKKIFTDLVGYLWEKEGHWLLHERNSRQEEAPEWLTRTPDRHAQIMRYLPVPPRAAPALSPVAEQMRRFDVKFRPISDLRGESQLSQATLLTVNRLLYANRPRGDIVSESNYRFWLGILCNLAVAYERFVGHETPINRDAVWDIANNLVEDKETEIPDIFYLMDMLGRVFAERPAADQKLVVPAEHLPQVFLMGEAGDDRVRKIAKYVIEQDCYEDGRGVDNARVENRPRLLAVYDWYAHLMSDDSPNINLPVAHGILKQLFPEDWKKDAGGLATYYDRKLMQMLAMERGLRGREVEPTGYVERSLPVSLFEDFVKAGKAEHPDLDLPYDELVDVMMKLFGRYYYIKRFTRGLFDFPNKRAIRRLDKVVKAMTLSGEIDPKLAKAVSKVFYEFYLYLRRRKSFWVQREKKESAPPKEVEVIWKGGKPPEAVVPEEAIAPEVEARVDDGLTTFNLPAILRAAAKELGGASAKQLKELARAVEAAPRVALAPAEAVAAAQPIHASVPAGWELGEHGLLSVHHFVEIKLIAGATASLIKDQLLADGVPDHLIGGVQRLLVNILVAYRARGGSLDKPDYQLLEKVALDFTKRGRARDPKRQAETRAGQLGRLFAKISFSENEAARLVDVKDDKPEPKIPMVDLMRQWIETVVAAVAPQDPQDREALIQLFGEAFEEILAPDYPNPLPLKERFRAILEQRARQKRITEAGVEPLTLWMEEAYDWLVAIGWVDPAQVRVEAGFREMTPKGWERGIGGLLPVEMLIEMGRVSAEISAGSMALLCQEGLPLEEVDRLNRLVVNLYAAWRVRGGKVEAVARDFAAKGGADAPARLVERYTERLQKLADWVQRERPDVAVGGAYPMLLLDILEARDPARFALASELILGKAEPPKRPGNKSERGQMRLLLNLRHHYGERGGNPAAVDREVATEILRNYVAAKSEDRLKFTIDGHIERLQRLLDLEQAAAGKA